MLDPVDRLIEYLVMHNNHDWASKVEGLRKEAAECEALRERVREAEAANELDRSRVAIALTELNAAIRSREWLLEGRGPYEWDDDDYRAEFTLWVRDVQKASGLFAGIASDWHGCPMDQTEIRHARAKIEGGADDRT